MKDWFVTKIELENSNPLTEESDGQFSDCNEIQEKPIINQLNNRLITMTIEFKHKYSRMTKSYRHILISQDIACAINRFNYKEIIMLNAIALENGFIALENDSGIINDCIRDISHCNKDCCLYNTCQLGPMRKLTEKESSEESL